MNGVVAISKKLARKDDFVVIPRREYEEFSSWKKIVKVNLEEKWFWTPEWQKKEAEADRSIRLGKVKGPFSNHQELLRALMRKQK